MGHGLRVARKLALSVGSNPASISITNLKLRNMIPEIDTLIAGVMEELAPAKAKYEKTKDGDLVPAISYLENKLALLRLISRDLMEVRTDSKRKSTAPLTEDEVKAVWQKTAKKCKDTAEEFTKINQLDRAQKELQDLDIIQSYMPEDWREADEATVRAYAEEVVNDFVKTNTTITMKNMGYVMGEVKKKYPTANGKVVSEVVKAHIGKP